MKHNFKVLLLVICFYQGIYGQTTNSMPGTNKIRCATEAPPAEWDQWFNQKVEEYKQSLATNKSQVAPVTIPVIVHVIHGGQAVGTFPNISQAQVNSQIAVLNQDFGGSGFNVQNIASTAFAAIGAVNSQITFCLAESDPNGTPLAEPGIERHNYNTEGWTNPASVTTINNFMSLMNGGIKPASIWNPTKFFNIWVTDANASLDLLGYATFPAGTGLAGLTSNLSTPTTDGIWVWSRAFGNVGTLQYPYNRGRTATHEAGHWLGLRHIGGDGNNNPSGDCAATDYCNDTPPQRGGNLGGQYGQNWGTPSYPLHLGVCAAAANGDMFMNFMDYCDDAYTYMFTPDQNIRFQTALTNSPYRNQLNASSATLCNVQAVAPAAMFTVAAGICRDSVLSPLNQSTGSPMPTYQWGTNPGVGVLFVPSSTVANPGIIFAFPGTYTITLDATNSAGTNGYFEYLVVTDCQDGVGIPTISLFANQLSLSPNPGSGDITLRTFFADQQDLSVTLFNSLGQKVMEKDFSNVSKSELKLQLHDLPTGVYSVSIANGKERVIKRLIINN